MGQGIFLSTKLLAGTELEHHSCIFETLYSSPFGSIVLTFFVLAFVLSLRGDYHGILTEMNLFLAAIPLLDEMT